MCHVTSGRLRQNLNVLLFQCALTVQMAQKFKTSEPAAGHVTRKIDPLNFTLKQSNLVYRLPAPKNTWSVTPLLICPPCHNPILNRVEEARELNWRKNLSCNNYFHLKVSKFRKQIMVQKFLPKNKPSSLSWKITTSRLIQKRVYLLAKRT